MRREVTRGRLSRLMAAIASNAPSAGGPYRVYWVGGSTAVWSGWRDSSIDVDLFTEQEELFRDVQWMKEHLNINIEFARPEHVVPPLAGAGDRHVFIEAVGPVQFYHYDPYSQLFSKVVRGFARDLDDAQDFVGSGMVETDRFRELVEAIPDTAFARYPSLSPSAVRRAVADFLSQAEA